MLLPSVEGNEGLASPLKPGERGCRINLSMCQFNAGAPLLPPAQVSQPTTKSMGTKAKHPLLKLQRSDGSRSLETFLMKFQHMATYLRWDDKDNFNHLGASLDGVVGQVLLPHTSTADPLCLLQTKFGTQLQTERFKIELRARRRATGVSTDSNHT